MRNVLHGGLRRSPADLLEENGVDTGDTRVLRPGLPQDVLPRYTKVPPHYLIKATPTQQNPCLLFQVRDTRDDPEDPHPEGGAGAAQRQRRGAGHAEGRECGERARVTPDQTGERGATLLAPGPDEEPQRQQQLRDEGVPEPRQHMTKVSPRGKTVFPLS